MNPGMSFSASGNVIYIHLYFCGKLLSFDQVADRGCRNSLHLSRL